MSAADNVVIRAAGDVAVQRDNPESAFAQAADFFHQADISFCNLEVIPCDESLEPTPFARTIRLRCDPEMIDGIKSAGFGVVTLANTHATDYGVEQLLQTMEILKKHKISYVGAGHNLDEARKPLIMEKKGVRLAFLAYLSHYQFASAASKLGPGVATVRVAPLLPEPHLNREEFERMKEDVAKAKSQADVVIISWHWGEPFTTALASHQPVLAHAAVDAGADIIIGHHPHILQGIEVYKGKTVFYSMGNVVFDMAPLPMSYDAIVVSCQVSAKGVEKVSFWPTLGTVQGQVKILQDSGEDAKRILTHMEKVCREFGTKLAVKGTEAVVLT